MRRGTMSCESSNLTVIRFIQKYAFDRFSPPLPEYELAFNKSCRFIEVSLEADGVHIIGHLWKLCKEAIEIPWRQLKILDTVKTLWVLHEYIEGPRRNAKIAHKLRKFLMNSKTSKSLANEYMWKIAEKVADALHNRDGTSPKEHIAVDYDKSAVEIFFDTIFETRAPIVQCPTLLEELNFILRDNNDNRPLDTYFPLEQYFMGNTTSDRHKKLAATAARVNEATRLLLRVTDPFPGHRINRDDASSSKKFSHIFERSLS